MIRTGLLFIVSTVLLMNSSCTTSDKEKSGTTPATSVDSVTVTLLRRTFRTSHIGLRHSSIALQKAASPEVAALARDIYEGQQQLANDVAQLAQSLNVEMPDTAHLSRDRNLDSLRKSPAGPELDAFVLRAITGIVRRELSTMEKMKDNGNAEVRELVSRNLPQVRTHLDSLSALRRRSSSRKP